MVENKTQKTEVDVTDFLNSLPDERKRQDSFTLLELMKEVTGHEPKMWGPSIIGFGDRHYSYESGREGDWFLVGFSPRKQNMTLYTVGGFPQYTELLNRLGKHKTGGGCLYINKISDVDQSILKQMIENSVQQAEQTNH